MKKFTLLVIVFALLSVVGLAQTKSNSKKSKKVNKPKMVKPVKYFIYDFSDPRNRIIVSMLCRDGYHPQCKDLETVPTRSKQ